MPKVIPFGLSVRKTIRQEKQEPTMKAYRTYSAAKRNNRANQPIVKVGKVYLVFDYLLDEASLGLVELAIIRDDLHTGHVSIKHLERLGNANWVEKSTK